MFSLYCTNKTSTQDFIIPSRYLHACMANTFVMCNYYTGQIKLSLKSVAQCAPLLRSAVTAKGLRCEVYLCIVAWNLLYGREGCFYYLSIVLEYQI